MNKMQKVAKVVEDGFVLLGTTLVSIGIGAVTGALQMGLTIVETQENLLKNYQFGVKRTK